MQQDVTCYGAANLLMYQVMLPAALLDRDIAALTAADAATVWKKEVKGTLAADGNSKAATEAALASFMAGAMLFKEYNPEGCLELWKVLQLCNLIGKQQAAWRKCFLKMGKAV